jgi:Fe-S-cluster containining protein
MDAEYKTSDDIFVCQMCGDCCNGFGGTYVTEDDIKRICDYTEIGESAFIEKYCDPSGSRFVLTLGDDGCCIFFDPEKQCTIHPVKPYMCCAWPFLKTIIKNPENWNAMASACPGMKKDIPPEDLKRIVALEKKKLDETYGTKGDRKP